MKDMINKEPYSEEYDVFLSYRRDGGEIMAILLHDRLSAKGYRTFLDIESLNSGSFNERLLSVIEGSANFVIVCSKDCLDRCVDENDWVRKEVAHALKHNKNIVPVMLRGFEWPETLPDDIDALRMQNGISAGTNEYFHAAIDRLADKFLVRTAKESKSPTSLFAKNKRKIRVGLIALAAILAVAGSMILSNFDFGAPQNNNDANNPPLNINATEPAIDFNAPQENNGANNPPPNINATEPAIDFITIKGVEYGTELYKLNLSNKGLTNTDIAPLRHMKNIEFLDLGGNQISDLSALSGLTSLITLYLYDNNRITDLTPLKNLTNLKSLSLYFNPISDITALSNLTKLEELVFREHPINDITPLKNLVNLVDLSLAECQIHDITPLSGLINLKKLSLNNNQISDITPLSGLTNLGELFINRNRISDLAPLSGLINLESLGLDYNQINDIAPLSGLANLITLSLSDNPIDDWSHAEHVRIVYGKPRR